MFNWRGWKRDKPRRVYAIGDIHGRLDLFKRLIALIKRDNAGRIPVPTRIVLLGDLVDHGPDSAQLVRYCKLLSEQTDRFVVLKGDHEAMMVDALRDGGMSAFDKWLDHGGSETLVSWGVPRDLIARGDRTGLVAAARDAVDDETIAWMDALPLTSRHEDHLFVHAGIRPGVKLKDQTERDLLGIRGQFLRSEDNHGVCVVHGHSVHESGPEMRPNRIGIDTGAFRTGRLSAIGVEDGQTWSLMTEPRPTDREREKARAELNDVMAGLRVL